MKALSMVENVQQGGNRGAALEIKCRAQWGSQSSSLKIT